MTLEQQKELGDFFDEMKKLCIERGFMPAALITKRLDKPNAGSIICGGNFQDVELLFRICKTFINGNISSVEAKQFIKRSN